MDAVKEKRAVLARTGCRLSGLTVIAVAVLAGFAVSRASAAGLPFVENFETRNEAPLHGQGGWKSVATANAVVQTTTVYGGGKAGDLGNVVLWQEFSGVPTATNVWADWYARPPRRTEAGDPVPGENSVVAFFVNSNGYLRVMSNTTWVTLSSYTVPEDTWVRLTAHLDYTNSTWALYVSDDIRNKLATPLATNLAFRAGGTNTVIGELRVTTAGTGVKCYLDSISVVDATDNGLPLHIDEGGDGISDRWALHFFNSTTNRSGDSDGDGWTDHEEYLAGTDPTNASSYMRVVGCDLATEAGDDIAFTIRGGDSMVTSIYAGDVISHTFSIRGADDNAAATKTLRATVTDNFTGTNVWTDTNAVNRYAAGYYDVGATMGGVQHLNDEEWAVYVQSRQDNYKYLVSVPVDLGSSNNLDSTLGEQLARGLRAVAVEADADVLSHRTAANQWKEYHLLSSGGPAFWWDFDNDTNADLTVTAGMGFWVERKSAGSLTRNNCVFGGRSFTNASAIGITTNFAYAGWRWSVFGWPFAQPKQHINQGIGSTASNQLGFAELGYGGKTVDYDRPHADKGDQIWVWEDNTFKDGYWLMDGIDGDHNGRWWCDRTGSFGDFSLEAGKAYLYRHHVGTNGATTGVNFDWTPTP